MSELWKPTDSTVLGMIRDSGEAALKGRDLSRIDRADRAMSVYKNNLQGLIDERLKSMFAEENYAALKLCAHTATNILERVVREIAIAYQQPATRYLKSETDGAQRATATGRLNELAAMRDEDILATDLTAETDAPVESPEAPATETDSPFEKWLAKSDLDGVMAEAQRLGKFNPAVWIKPEIREELLEFDLYTPASADILPDPKSKTRAIGWYTWRDEPVRQTDLDAPRGIVGVFKKKPEARTVFHLWDRTTYYQINEKGEDIRPPEPTRTPGRLPVVALRLGRPIDSYYLDGMGGDLYDATLEVCALKSVQNRSALDSFKQIVIQGIDQDKIPIAQVVGNPAYPIGVPESGAATVLDHTLQLADIGAMITEREQGIATKYGISPDAWRAGGSVQSGFSKRLDKARILEMNAEDRKYLSTAEADLYRLCAALGNLPEIGTLDEGAEFVIDFGEPKFETEPEEEARVRSQRISLGVESIVDWVMDENPDLTEEEAIQLLARNRMLNARFGGGKKPMSLIETLAGGKAEAPPGGRPVVP
jgi:hypothetical protein